MLRARASWQPTAATATNCQSQSSHTRWSKSEMPMYAKTRVSQRKAKTFERWSVATFPWLDRL